MNCFSGGDHTWVPTGHGYFLWFSSQTSPPQEKFEGAPFFQEYRCNLCGSTQYVKDAVDLND